MSVSAAIINICKTYLPFSLLVSASFLMPCWRYYFPSMQLLYVDNSFIAVTELLFFLSVICSNRHSLCFSSLEKRLIIFWVTWCILATLTADHFTAALVRQAEWFCHIIFIYSCALFFRDKKQFLPPFLWGLSIAGLLYILYVYNLWYSIPNPQTLDWVASLPGFANIRHSAHIILPCLILSGIPWLVKIGEKPYLTRALSLFVMTSCWAFLFWSGSRGAILSALISLFLFWLSARKKLASEGVILCFLLTMCSGIYIASNYPTNTITINQSAGKTGIDHIFDVAEINDAESFNKVTSGRIDMWVNALQYSFKHPFFGNGPDGYSFLPENMRKSVLHPHNWILLSIIEWGWIGAIVFLALTINMAVKMKKSFQLMDQQSLGTFLIMFHATTALIILSLFSGVTYFGRSLFVLSFLIGCLMSCLVFELRPLQKQTMKYLVSIPVFLSLIVTTQWMVAIIINDTSKVPSPDSWQARLVKQFPSSVESRRFKAGADWWATEWAKENPEISIEWLHWAHEHARNPWVFYLIEARLLAKEGNKTEALSHFLISKQLAPQRRHILRRIEADQKEFGLVP